MEGPAKGLGINDPGKKPGGEVLKPGGPDARDGTGMLAWKVVPVSESKFVLGAVALVILLTSFGAWGLARDYLLGVFAALVLFASLSSFFFPTSYALGKDGILITTPFGRRRKPWSGFQSFSSDRHGVTLSPFPARTWLEPYRVTRIRFKNNRNEVLEFIAGKLGSGADRTSEKTKSASKAQKDVPPPGLPGTGLPAEIRQEPAGLPGDGDGLSAEDRAIIDSLARRIVGLRMSVPAVFFLESTKPLSFLGSQAVSFFEPFVRTFFSVPNYERFGRLMEDRTNIDILMDKVEFLDREQQKKEKMFRAEHPGFLSRMGRKVGSKLRMRGK